MSDRGGIQGWMVSRAERPRSVAQLWLWGGQDRLRCRTLFDSPTCISDRGGVCVVMKKVGGSPASRQSMVTRAHLRIYIKRLGCHDVIGCKVVLA